MKAKSTLSIILAVLLIIALAAAGWFAWAYFTADDQLPIG